MPIALQILITLLILVGLLIAWVINGTIRGKREQLVGEQPVREPQAKEELARGNYTTPCPKCGGIVRLDYSTMHSEIACPHCESAFLMPAPPWIAIPHKSMPPPILATVGLLFVFVAMFYMMAPNIFHTTWVITGKGASTALAQSQFTLIFTKILCGMCALLAIIMIPSKLSDLLLHFRHLPKLEIHEDRLFYNSGFTGRQQMLYSEITSLSEQDHDDTRILHLADRNHNWSLSSTDFRDLKTYEFMRDYICSKSINARVGPAT